MDKIASIKPKSPLPYYQSLKLLQGGWLVAVKKRGRALRGRRMGRLRKSCKMLNWLQSTI